MTQEQGAGLSSTALVLAMLLGLLFAVPTGTVSAAQDGDFTYTISGDPVGATVTGYTGPDGVAMVIPAMLGGYPTVAIGDYAFSTVYSPTSVSIPDSVKSIGVYAFANLNSMSTVDLGNGVTTIGHHAFYDCHGLTSVIIPDSVISIGLAAFYNCGLMTSVTIGRNVTTIDVGAFINCMCMMSITIPDSVTSIGFLAFYRCSGLVQVDIGNSLDMLGYMAFSNCTSLAMVTIPDSTTSIGYGAFSDCPSLASVTIGSSVTSIGYDAFRNCTGLNSIAFRGHAAPFVGADWITNTPSGIRGHALADSDFPAPGNEFNGLMMGQALSPTPSRPTIINATQGGSQISLTWSPPLSIGNSAITNYHIYRSMAEADGYALIASPSESSYTDTGLTNGQTYWYKVSAVNAAGEGTNSSAVSVTLPQAIVADDDSTPLLVLAAIAICASIVAAVVFVRRGKK